MDAVTEHIAGRVRALRGAARLSGPALAVAMNDRGIPWNRSTVAKLETGRRESVAVQELLALAAVFGIAPADLLPDRPCVGCGDSPPAGFTCNRCKRSA